MKKCTKCMEEKEESEFSKNKGERDGLNYWCKKCVREKKKSYIENNFTGGVSDITHKTCSKCKEVKSIDSFGLQRSNKDGYSSWCKDCRRNVINDFRERVGGSSTYSKRNKDSANKRRNSIRIGSLIQKNRLDKPTTFLCSNVKCTEIAEEYHHLRYDDVENGDNVSIITPLCRRCHNMIEDENLSPSVQVSLKIQIECFGQGKKSHITYLKD